VSLLSGLIAGWWPAFKLARAASPLTRPAAPAGMSRRGGQTLIAAEVALALVLLTGAALMLRSFGRMVSVDIGFDPESFVTMDVVPIAGSAAEHATYYPELLRRLRTLPGVEAVGAINHLPLVGLATITAAGVEGRASVSVFQRTILPGYFEALGLQLVRGRTLTDADMAAAAPVMVAGEATAGLLSPDAPILGRHVQFGRQSLEVIGVVRSVRHSGPLNPGHADLYVPSWISIGGSRVRGPQPLSVVIRPAPGATVTAETLRTVAESLGTRVLVERIRPGGQLFGDRVINPRRRTVLLSLLGGLGLLLALVGIFGVTAYTVARRTREIGVRMAFGARARQVVGTMLRDAVWPVAIGLAVGLAGATFATKVIASFLFETTPTDVPTFAAVAIALAVSAMIAAWIPARRAARVDPVSALRSE
jgi:predicted permease